VSNPVNIPNKELFKLNEVCGLLGVKPYVLRFWESEFPEISPQVTEDGVKQYSQEDIEAVALIKKLLFDDKLTIEKAKGEIALRMMNHKGNRGPLPLGEEKVKEAKEEQVEEIKVEQDKVDLPDLEKIVVAKEKLEKIVNLTKSLEKLNYWN